MFDIIVYVIAYIVGPPVPGRRHVNVHPYGAEGSYTWLIKMVLKIFWIVLVGEELGDYFFPAETGSDVVESEDEMSAKDNAEGNNGAKPFPKRILLYPYCLLI